eukprot:TRINITY_DN6643_c5_g1_i1.p1 TRINITY_DN6643_c5_g1~~TRINITY_DN6643_c5_g1_i1.p1  ORF type:complete len:971 (+),score=241.45 TRINITY_DN6643_c5_g1_i1:73-2985(+)
MLAAVRRVRQLYADLVSLSHSPGDTPEDIERKELLIGPAFVCGLYVVVRTLSGDDGSTVNAYAVGSIFIVIGAWGLALVPFVTKRAAASSIGWGTVFATVGILLHDWYFAAEVGARRSWMFAVLVLDAQLILKLPAWTHGAVLGLTVSWLLVAALESTYRFGAFDLDGWAHGSLRPEVCNCDHPPCGVSLARSLGDFAGVVIILLLDFYFTHQFVRGALLHRASINASIEVAEHVSMLLAGYETAAAQSLVTGAGGNKLPPRLRAALQTLLHNLTAFRPYIPDVLIAGECTDDLLSRSTTATTEPRLSFSKPVERQDRESLNTYRSCSSTSLKNAAERRHSTDEQEVPLAVHTLGLTRKGLTVLSARLDVDDSSDNGSSCSMLAATANGFVEGLSAAVRAHQGTMLHIRGHSALAAWGALHQRHGSGGHPRQACSAAIAATQAPKYGAAATSVSMGTGFSGNVGGGSARCPVLFGSVVERASVMVRLGPHLQCPVLADELVHRQAHFQFTMRPVDRVCSTVRAPASGSSEVYTIYQVLAQREDKGVEWLYDLPSESESDTDTHGAAFFAMLAGDTGRALQLLGRRSLAVSCVQSDQSKRCSDDNGAVARSAWGLDDSQRSDGTPNKGPATTSRSWRSRDVDYVDPAVSRLRRVCLCATFPTPYVRRAPLPPFEVFPGELDTETTSEGGTPQKRDDAAASVRSVDSFAAGHPVLPGGCAQDHQRRLLYMLLPRSIIKKLSAAESGSAIVDEYRECSVVFADIVGFTARTAATPPITLVRTLMEVFGIFDDICADSPLTKIKTIGDCYMAACGTPEPCADHGKHTVLFALRLTKALELYNKDRATDLKTRVGISSGALVGGVIGSQQLCFDVWGDTVNVAARMEQTGKAKQVQISEATRRLLPEDMLVGDTAVAEITETRDVEVKGRGRMACHFVAERGNKAGDMRQYLGSTHKGTKNVKMEALFLREFLGL